jgi:addiction module RelE/StbE family toxin
MKVRFNRGALHDLEEIFDFISADNSLAAASLIERIERAAALIGHVPEIGVKTSRPQFRKFPVGNYLIVYEITPDEVVIQYVRHGARRRPWEGE